MFVFPEASAFGKRPPVPLRDAADVLYSGIRIVRTKRPYLV